MGSQAQVSEAWIRAQTQFVKDLSEDEQRKFFKASPESLLDDAVAAEGSHAERSTTRRVIEKLQPFVAAVEQYGEAIDVYSSTYSLALGPIWGSMKVLLHIAREFGKYFEKLVDMFTRIGDVLPRFKTYERLFSNHDQLIGALSKAYLEIITFCSDAKAVFRRGQRSPKATLKITLKLLWKPFDLQFGQQLSTFREHQKSVEKEAGLANMIEAADARAVMLVDQKQLEKRRQEDNRLRIIAMFNAIDYEAKHRRLQSLRHAGTGEWLYSQAEYIDWGIPGRSAFLGCHGIPGCGKSILASNLVDTLIEAGSASTTPAPDVLYYYCDYADQRSLLFERILGSLLKQLFIKRQIPEPIESQLLQVYAAGTRSPSEKALTNIFCSSVALLNGLYIIFDGLDECDKAVSRALLKIFKQLGATGPTNIKIFLTCVEEGSVAHSLHDFTQIQLSPSVTSADIKAFVESSVRQKIEDGELKMRNPSLEEDIIGELVLKANGLFLWVYFQLEEVCNASSDSMIRTILTNLPTGLGETYRRILTGISQNPLGAQLAQKMFKWATVAKRPLHIEEFKEAVAFDPSDKSWIEDKIPHEDRMFESCRGLIVKDAEDQTVRFAHHTVLQYLTTGLSTTVDPFFKISTIDAETFAGQFCVGYLLFSDFETQLTTAPLNLGNQGVLQSGGPLKIPDILGIKAPIALPYRLFREKTSSRAPQMDYSKHLSSRFLAKTNSPIALDDKYRLLQYVIDYWETHVRSFPTSNAKLYSTLGRLVLEKTLAFEFRPWGPNQHHGPYGCVGCPNLRTNDLDAAGLPHVSMLHYAAEVGNMPLLLLVKDVVGLQTRDISDYLRHERYHDETLLIACRHGKIEIVKFLITLRAFDLADGRAASAASIAGHADVLQYLLSIDRSGIGQQGEKMLLAAAKHGYDAIVGILVEVGVSLEATDEQTGLCVLELAAMDGHDLVVRSLFKRGAQTRTSSDFYREQTALSLAATKGHAAAARALLESIPWSVNDRKTALFAAARSGHSAVAEALLEYDTNSAGRLITKAKYPSSSKEPETAFHIAAQNGHVEILGLFKDYVQSVDSPRIFKEETALHVAAAAGQSDVVQWLIDNGADVNATTPLGDSCLSFAISAGDETVVRILLDYGAMVFNPPYIFPKDPLTRAAALEETTILELLLGSMRGDRKSPREVKRTAIMKALSQNTNTSTEQMMAAVAILKRELELYRSIATAQKT